MSAPGNKRRRDDGGRNDWRTPPELFRLLDMEFRFTLDAAADDENHLCERYLTEAEDALSADVADHVVWCNPPYGDLAPWVTAFATWAIKGHCTVVALLPAATDTRACCMCGGSAMHQRSPRDRARYGHQEEQHE
jgi:phage N-6-adenine-methyltransferase